MEIFLKTVSALNDETRLLILRFIDENGECCVCDLQNSLDMIQSRLSRHLKILKDAGFLRVERKGTWAYYSVRTPLDRFRLEALEEVRCLDIKLPKLQTSQTSSGCSI
jgi:ArsR family transcriptional regulator